MMKRTVSVLLVLVLLAGVLPLGVSALEVSGKSAVLMDVATGTVLSAQNEHAKLHPASVTKVMTLLLIMEAIDSGRIGWEDTVTASAAAAVFPGKALLG